MISGRATASAAALVALVGGVGTITYVAVREDPAPPPTTTTTTVRPPTDEEIANAVAVALSDGLDVPLDGMEAVCVADGVLAGLGSARLEELAALHAAVDDLTAEERHGLVRSIVACVPPEKAAALLGTGSPPATVNGLPDNGDEG